MSSPCGTAAGYTGGCRCTPCRNANTTRQREWRQNKRIYGVGEKTMIALAPKPMAVMSGFKPSGDWAHRGTCRRNGNQWILTETQVRTTNPRRFNEVARMIDACNACPVLTECRTWVLAHTIDPCPWHVVAAMTPRQRNNARRELGIPTPGRHPNQGAA